MAKVICGACHGTRPCGCAQDLKRQLKAGATRNGKPLNRKKR